jgi:antirestriction protein ArdC
MPHQPAEGSYPLRKLPFALWEEVMNVYQMVNDRIMELLQQGTVPWRRPWDAKFSFPRSLSTGKEYKGINMFLLASLSYSSPWFGTFNEIKSRGGHVKRGEHAVPVIFWRIINTPDQDNSEKIHKIPMLRYYQVFHVATQSEGVKLPEPEEETVKEFSPIDTAEMIIQNMPLRPEIRYGKDRAYYSVSQDIVYMPPKESFESPEELYSTTFHEISHSTMAEHRLNRKATMKIVSWGDESYAREELCAAMSEGYLCAYAGIEQKTIANLASYVAGWMKAIKDDKTLFLHAAQAAQKSADYILNKQEDHIELDEAA